MHLTENGVQEHLQNFFIDYTNHVIIKCDKDYAQNRLIELEIISPLPGITQMLKEHFARFTNIRITQARQASAT